MQQANRPLQIATLLTTYQPTDAQETAYQQRMLELLGAGEPGLLRTHFTPGHFTASGFVTNPERSALALILHKKLNIWVQPGGHVEPSDATLAAAALREVQEELVLDDVAFAQDAVFDIDIHTIGARKDEPAHQHFDVRFLFVTRDAKLRGSDEVLDARWVQLAELQTFATDASVLRAAYKLGLGE